MMKMVIVIGIMKALLNLEVWKKLIHQSLKLLKAGVYVNGDKLMFNYEKGE